MPYIPPHLRPGYIPAAPLAKPDFTGKVHWITDKNNMRTTDVVEGSKAHSPHFGIVAAKSALKMTRPITLNNKPLAKPSMRLGHSKFNVAVRRHLSRKFKSKKRASRRRSMTHKKKTKKMTYKRKTY
jgi:hypothetical protein